mmetsp:Transcript_26755/g.58796  ORF Transcript_26755/g.58796 Transcript_26755/m.58796 type:complete len:227 (+) Transcript_26755:149-829(+)
MCLSHFDGMHHPEEADGIHATQVLSTKGIEKFHHLLQWVPSLQFCKDHLEVRNIQQLYGRRVALEVEMSSHLPRARKRQTDLQREFILLRVGEAIKAFADALYKVGELFEGERLTAVCIDLLHDHSHFELLLARLRHAAKVAKESDGFLQIDLTAPVCIVVIKELKQLLVLLLSLDLPQNVHQGQELREAALLVVFNRRLSNYGPGPVGLGSRSCLDLEFCPADHG